MRERTNRRELVSVINSPIEFVITGPLDGRDVVLAKSNDAKLDLVGLAIGGSAYVERPDLLSTFFPASRQLNKVDGLRVKDPYESVDKRDSKLIFAWSGFSSSYGINYVEDAFKLQSFDIYRAIDDGNEKDLEMALSPVIFTCSQVNQRRLRFRRLLAATTITYIALAVFGLVVTSLAVFAKRYGI